MPKKSFWFLFLTMAIGLGLASGARAAAPNACSLVQAAEASQVMGTAMRGSPIMDDRCYFIGEHHELTVIVMDKASYDRQKQFLSSPIAQQGGAKIEPLPGVSPEALYQPVSGDLDVSFAKGDNAVTLQVRTGGQGPTVDKPLAQAIGKLVMPRLP
jgi:hypothetical protein